MRKSREPRWRKIGGISAALLTLALVLAGCGAGTGAGDQPIPPATLAGTATTQISQPAVSISSDGESGYGYGSGSFSFIPASITVKVGTTVVWTNTSGTSHTVTSDAGAPAAFDSGMVNGSNGTFSFTFTRPGTYTYHCNVHPYMQGTIIVIA